MNNNDQTVFDPGATMRERDETIYEGAATVQDSAATQLDDGATMLEATLSDAAGRTDTPVSNLSIQKGDTILDTYKVESNAIEGGMGSVWRVHHTGWNTDLAMKRPQPQCFATEKSKADFIHECEAWINLGLHPNIVSCYYVREISGTPSIFSEWMDGGSLESAINKGTLYDGMEAEQQERILDIAIQFARGLHYAHEAGLIHQDVKPDNLLLTKDGDAKVADFGLARARAVLTVAESAPNVQENADSGKTIVSPSGGFTPAYCSMEQMDGKALTRRTDIYSWAVSIMEMYIGSRPWANGVVAGLSCRGYFEDTKLPMPEALKELLGKCMEAEPDKRPYDFAEIEAKLHEIYKTETGGDYPRPAPKAAADTADSLNNRALSMLDLGKQEEAERLWERALEMEPYHMLSAYNRRLFWWRSGRSDAHNEYTFQELRGIGEALHKETLAESLLDAIRMEKGVLDIETCCVWEGSDDGHEKLRPQGDDGPYSVKLTSSGILHKKYDEKAPHYGSITEMLTITDAQTGRKRKYAMRIHEYGDKPYVDDSGLICFRKKRYAYPSWGPLAAYELSHVESISEHLQKESIIAACKKELSAALAHKDVSAALRSLEQLKNICGRHLPMFFDAEEKEVARYCKVIALTRKYEIKTPPCQMDTARSNSIPEYVKLTHSLKRQLKDEKIHCTASSVDGTRFYLCGGDYALLILDSRSGEILHAIQCKNSNVAIREGHDILIPYLHNGKHYLATNRCKMDDQFHVIEAVKSNDNKDICLCEKSGLFLTVSSEKPDNDSFLYPKLPTIRAVGFSQDGRYAREAYRTYYYDYSYEFPGWVDWDEGARPYLQGFLVRHPEWTERDFEEFILLLQNRGFGYIRPDGVRAKLAEMKPKKTGLFGKRK